MLSALQSRRPRGQAGLFPRQNPPYIGPGQGAKNTSGWPAGLSAWEPTRGHTWGLGSCTPPQHFYPNLHFTKFCNLSF